MGVFRGAKTARLRDADAKNLTQAQIIIAGLIGGVVFVLTLLLAVYLVLQSVK